MKKSFIILIPVIFFLGACGGDGPSSSTKPYAKVYDDSDYAEVNSYLVKADGVVYRCFDTGYKGGIWCTEKPEGEIK